MRDLWNAWLTAMMTEAARLGVDPPYLQPY